MMSECVLVQTFVFVISGPQPGALACQCLDFGKTETSSPGSHPEKSELGCTAQCSLSLLNYMFSPSWAALHRGRNYRE